MDLSAQLPEVDLYIAMSLDGYIADPEGGVGWLSMVETAGEDYGYASFYDSVEAVFMGSHTYEQIAQFGHWPYEGKPCHVFSRRALQADGDVTVTASEPREVLNNLAQEGVRRAWLVGGAELTSSFRVNRLISRYIISLVPILLGSGIRLFSPPLPEERLKLTGTRSYPSGLVQMTYEPADGAG